MDAMDTFISPMRMIPPLTPRRVPSPVMSPGGRRGRAYGSLEDTRPRDLSPETTFRAFTETPMPFDTTRDQYRLLACIDTLTVAERDLGARVAKAAQRLKTWCAEIEQWGWSGTFEQPSEDFKEKRRKSIELHIREHVVDSNLDHALPPLDYWGSLLSVEVEQHEARLDDIEDEMLKLDVEELKEHVLDMHPAARSRPTSAGYEASRQHYRIMDDFSFLITQTLLCALPHHAQLKDRLSTWTARVSILRQAPKYTSELDIAQRAMRLGWDAIEPPADTSDEAFAKWKEAVDTISVVLHQRVSDLGRCLDRMLDTLEGREDCLPDSWIDTFESTEADYGRWKHESRRRVIDFDLRRRTEGSIRPDMLKTRIDSAGSIDDTSSPDAGSPTHSLESIENTKGGHDTAFGSSDAHSFTGDRSAAEVKLEHDTGLLHESATMPSQHSNSITYMDPGQISLESELLSEDDSEFDEGDTIVHHDLDESPQHVITQSVPDSFPSDQTSENPSHIRPETLVFSGNPTITANDCHDGAVMEPPHTPRSWRGSLGSFSTDLSPDSSPRSVVEESPSVRNATNRIVRAARPELNAAMAKRRPMTSSAIPDDALSAPWPPSHFAQKSISSAEELERKISDILTTIPAHIRLTSGPGPDAPEVKSTRSLMAKGRPGLLRAARSVSGLKSPELTLSPARSEFEVMNGPPGRRSAAAARGDNDIKLYHLTQPGKELPIKLFIRRVGENGERVMVRVGGGWSDLGEYLRQYAEHHGRRTASEGKFEVVGLEVKNPDASPSRSESGMGKRERRISSGYPLASPVTTPIKSAVGRGILSDEAPPPIPNFATYSPGGPEDPNHPLTGSPRTSWQGKEVGLAGPKAKKLDLSGEKLEWIEGMMKQARTVSSNVIHTTHPAFLRDERIDSRSDSRPVSRPVSRPGSRTGPGAAKKPEFGDLGKVGGTKRVFMKGSNHSFGDC
ncbi:gas2 domain-containing [Pyrenophora seminiperda CCB06]|uniref:Gas2 domain-containing n=1 Tax=Pyrenophora seminiperda CCB06 TaxID=1302712 RepID=A0A3M7MI48_9PLEO|nr:gas2 domain-containing [Pyrenophora seminiperda CCB06]